MNREEEERHRDEEVEEGELRESKRSQDMQSSDSEREMRVLELSQVISSPAAPHGMNIVTT